MTALHPPIAPLDASHHDELASWFGRHPSAHVFQLNQIERGSLESDRRGTWIGCRNPDGTLRAVLYTRFSIDTRHATNAVPSGEPAACEILGQRLHRMGGSRMIVGERASCDALWRGMRKPWYRIAYDQRLYTCIQVSDGPSLPVECATPDDVEALVPMHTEMLREDLGVHKDSIDRFAQWAQLHRSVSSGRILVVRGGTSITPIRFCIDIGDPASMGAQVGGTFVPDSYRGKGVATAAMRGVCSYLFREHAVPRVTLHVHERNAAAVRCYQKAGFETDAAFRLMVR